MQPEPTSSGGIGPEVRRSMGEASRRPARRRSPSRNGRDGEHPMMDIDEVAWRLGTSVRHIRRLVLERRIPFHKIGGKLRFDPAVIDEWVTGSLVPAIQEPDWVRPIPGTVAGQRPRRRSAS